LNTIVNEILKCFDIVHKLLITISNKVTEVSLFSDISSIQKLHQNIPVTLVKKDLVTKATKAMMVVTDPSSKNMRVKNYVCHIITF
jgi:hypothetical protein